MRCTVPRDRSGLSAREKSVPLHPGIERSGCCDRVSFFRDAVDDLRELLRRIESFIHRRERYRVGEGDRVIDIDDRVDEFGCGGDDRVRLAKKHLNKFHEAEERRRGGDRVTPAVSDLLFDVDFLDEELLVHTTRGIGDGDDLSNLKAVDLRIPDGRDNGIADSL